MKIEKFREMTDLDLQRKLIELQDTLMKTKVKIQTKQVENTAQLTTLRRDIARVRTLMREMALKAKVAPQTPIPASTEAAKPAPSKS